MTNYLAHTVSSSHIHSGNDSSAVIYIGFVILVIICLIAATITLISKQEKETD